MARIGNLSTSLTLESASFLEGVKRVRSSVDQLDRNVTSRLNNIQKSAAGVGSALKATLAGLAIGFATDGLQTAINSGLEYASSLTKVAQQLGVTTRTLQEYRYIATQTGVSQEQLDAGLARLTRSLGMAEAGNKPLIAAFKELDVTARSTDEALPQIIAGLSKIEDPAKRAALEVTIFGKAGQKLDTLLSGGIDQVDQLRDAAHRLGIVLSDEQIQKADDTADKLASLQMVLKARIAAEVADNTDAIVTLSNALVGFAGNAASATASAARFFSLVGGNVASGQALVPAWIAAGRQEDATRANAAIANMPGMAAFNRSLGLGGSARPATAGPTLDLTGGGGGGRKTRRSRGGGRAKKEDTPQEIAADIMDRLFPDEAETKQLFDQWDKLGQALLAKAIPQADYDRAVAAIQQKLGTVGDDVFKQVDELDRQVNEDSNRLIEALGANPQWGVSLEDRNAIAKDKNKALKQNFADTARDISDSLSNLANEMRGGGVLGVLSGLLDLGMTLGGAGLFGKKVQTNLLAGKRAAGGPMSSGLPYLVGERGPELVVPHANSTVIPNNRLRAGNDNRPMYFDLSGAVMTADLLQQMQAMATATSGAVVRGAMAKSAARSGRALAR